MRSFDNTSSVCKISDVRSELHSYSPALLIAMESFVEVGKFARPRWQLRPIMCRHSISRLQVVACSDPQQSQILYACSALMTNSRCRHGA